MNLTADESARVEAILNANPAPTPAMLAVHQRQVARVSQGRITTRRARALSALFLGAAALVAFAMFVALGGCGTAGQGQDVHLAGNGGELFRKLTGASAITVSESTTIYGVDTPSNPQLVCHETRHKLQAKVIADALVLIGAIDDDEPSRMAAWIAVYSIEHIQRGYAGNRFEVEAHNACKDVQ